MYPDTEYLRFEINKLFNTKSINLLPIGKPMEMKDLLEAYTLSAQNIDSLWEFFVTVHMALFGAFFYLHKVEKYQLFIFMISYILFTLINIRAKITEYNFYNSIINDTSSKCNDNSHLCNFFHNYSPDDRIHITIAVHILAFIAVSYLSYNTWHLINSKNKKSK